MINQCILLLNKAICGKNCLSLLVISVLIMAPEMSAAQHNDVYDLVIVGGGYAGMGALRQARALGLKALLVEKSPELGGVAISIRSPVGNFWEDKGPQFILDHYAEIFSMIREAGLQNQLLNINSPGATVRNGRIIGFDPNDPMSIYYNGILGDVRPQLPVLTMVNPLSYLNPIGGLLFGYAESKLREYNSTPAREGRQIVRSYQNLIAQVADRSPVDMGDWARFDDETIESWGYGPNGYGADGTEQLIEPLMAGLFFQSIADVTKAAFFWMARNLNAGERWYVMRDGLQSILTQLYHKYRSDIRLSTEVNEIASDGGGVLVKTSGGPIHAKGVVIAAPAPLADHFFKTPEARALLSPIQSQYLKITEFAASIVVNVHFDKSIMEGLEALRRSPMLAFPRRERNRLSPVAAFSIASNQGRQTGDIQEIGVHMTDEAARFYMNKSDREIEDAIISQLSEYFPIARYGRPVFTIQRIPYATSKMPVGRARFVKSLWDDQRQAKSKILFAGQGTGWPTIEESARKGKLAGTIISELIRGEPHCATVVTRQ